MYQKRTFQGKMEHFKSENDGNILIWFEQVGHNYHWMH